MTRISKLAALAVGTLSAVSAVALAHPQDPGTSALAGKPTVVVSGGLIWHEQSDVAARREGVVNKIEFNVGDRIEEGQEIGTLHDEIAALNLKKSEVVANSVAAEKKAEAQRGQAMATLSRIYRLKQRDPGLVTPEEEGKAEADVNYADALKLEAQEKRAADVAEKDLARQILDEHHIIAPFSGVVIERHVNPEEAVQANQPVVRIGKTDKFRFVGWMPLESSLRIQKGDPVQFRPIIENADLPIEQQVYSGRVMATSTEVAVSGRSETYVLAEIENPPRPQQRQLELLQGMRGELVIYLSDGAAASAPPAQAPAAPGLGAGPATATRR